MKKEVLIEEYKENGLVISDFHLGLRLSKPIFLNTIVSGFILVLYLSFMYSIYEIISQNHQKLEVNIGVYAVYLMFIVLVLQYTKKIVIYLYLIVLVLLLSVRYTDIVYSDKVQAILENPVVSEVVFGLFALAVLSTIMVYRTNRNIVIKNGLLSIPATDVERGIFAFIILKPFWGLFYRKKIVLDDIISVKNDGYGSKKKEIYPITITDKKASNSVVFTSRQKRDEFRTKISVILGIRDASGASFGES